MDHARYFSVVTNDRAYCAIGHDWDTLETIWLSQKSWFSKGTKVTITDDKGNTMTFIK